MMVEFLAGVFSLIGVLALIIGVISVFWPLKRFHVQTRKTAIAMVISGVLLMVIGGAMSLTTPPRQVAENPTTATTIPAAAPNREVQLAPITTPRIAGSEEPNQTAKKCKYIGNIRTHIFHRGNQSASHLPKPKNRVCFSTRTKAIHAGYRPCKVCKP